MKGVLLCKFDEERGYIPVKVYPPRVRKRSNMGLFKEIARNAIGFGTQVEYQQFTLADNSSEIHCLAKRFSIPIEGARGGSELYALVIFSGDSEEFPKKLLGESTQKLIANWEARTEIIKSLYEAFNPTISSSISPSISVDTSSISRPLLPQELFTEKTGFFAEGHTLTRNLLMLLSVIAMFWVIYLNYNIFSFSFMVTVGIFVFTIVAKKDKSLKIINGFMFFFIILLFIKLFFELIGESSTIAILGTFPDFTRPDLAILSFFGGILICLGLDRGHAVDKASFIIGICGIVFFILFFLTPFFEIIFAFFEGLA